VGLRHGATVGYGDKYPVTTGGRIVEPMRPRLLAIYAEVCG
jgi:hypothetical protein